MSTFWENQFVQSAANFSVVVLSVIVFLAVFELVTKYKNWEEIKNGNVAVALATGGKIFGLTNIFYFSISHHDKLLKMLGHSLFGFSLLLIGYFIFEFLTPTFNIDDEIASGNRAVGFISFIISVGLSFVIGAGIR